MKKLVLIILSLCFLTSMTIKSQTTTVCVPSKFSSLTIIDSTANWIGEQHNIILEAIYDSIKANPSEFTITNGQIPIDTIIRACINSSKIHLSSINVDSIKTFVNLCKSEYESYKYTYDIYGNGVLYYKINNLYQNNLLSDEGKNILLQLYSIMNSLDTVHYWKYFYYENSLIRSLITQAENGYKNKTGITNPNELRIVLTGLYVGEYSMLYWMNNIEKWYIAMPSLEINIRNAVDGPPQNGYTWASPTACTLSDPMNHNGPCTPIQPPDPAIGVDIAAAICCAITGPSTWWAIGIIVSASGAEGYSEWYHNH